MRAIALAAVLFLLGVSVSWGSPRAALRAATVKNPTSTAKTRWRGTVAKLPANAATGKNRAAGFSSISCASHGNCTAVGSYRTTGGHWEGLLVTEEAGHWKKGVEAILPANAESDPDVSLTSVSCPSAGNCTAVGTYRSDSSGGIYSEGWPLGLLLNEKAGHWAAGVEAVLPADASALLGVFLHSVSCASPGNCTAAGNWGYSYEYPRALLFTETAGRWARGVHVGYGRGELDSVSCASDGSCSAVGYDNGGYTRAGTDTGDPLLLTKKRGKWRRVWPDVDLGESAFLSAVSCVSAGNCGVVGLSNIGIDDEYGPRGLLLTERAGDWHEATAKPPKNADPSVVEPAGISCASPGDCAVMGNYYGRRIHNDNEHLTLLTEDAGRWQRGVEAVLPRHTNSPTGAAVSCASPGSCTVVGSYWRGASRSRGLLLTELAGRWARGVRPPHLPHSQDSVASVSCTAPGNCGAVGVSWIYGGPSYGLLLDSTTDPCVVPELIGKTLSAARQSIEAHNCFVGRIEHVRSGTVESGHVIGQSLRPGRHRVPGTKVNLEVSSGA